jgi:hypothetical protein
MTHRLSADDIEFRTLFESGEFPPGEFDHRAHLRLAYIYLAEYDTDAAYRSMRSALRSFLAHLGIDASKYHDTLTRAWVMAVRHFMEKTPAADSADAFIYQNPQMLDSKIMLSHYSAELLFSDEARARFMEPDLESIPEYQESDRNGEP